MSVRIVILACMFGPSSHAPELIKAKFIMAKPYFTMISATCCLHGVKIDPVVKTVL